LTRELENIVQFNNWTNFPLSIKYEKIIGSIIDTLDVKEIIILKYASVIGNIFDFEKLSKIITFNNINDDDLFQILQKFEVKLKFTLDPWDN
jgi:hypothetical protein